MDDLLYTLKHPIVPKQGDAIDSVVVRRPKGKDMKAADRAGSDFEGTLILIERLSSLPGGGDVFAGFAEELDVEDIEGLGERVEAMLPRGQKTGGTI